jgi:hypothetical protein
VLSIEAGVFGSEARASGGERRIRPNVEPQASPSIPDDAEAGRERLSVTRQSIEQ